MSFLCRAFDRKSGAQVADSEQRFRRFVDAYHYVLELRQRYPAPAYKVWLSGPLSNADVTRLKMLREQYGVDLQVD